MNRLLIVAAGIAALTAVGCAARLPKTTDDSLMAVVQEGGEKARPHSAEEIERAQEALEEIPIRPRSEALADARRLALEQSPENDEQPDYLSEEVKYGRPAQKVVDPKQANATQKVPVRFAGQSGADQKRRPKSTPNEVENDLDNEPDLNELMARAIERGNAALRQESTSGDDRPKLVRQVSWSAESDSITIPLTSARQPESDSQPSKRKSLASTGRKADVELAFAEDDPPPSVKTSDNKLRRSETARKSDNSPPKKQATQGTAKAPADWPAAHREATAALKEKIRKARSEGTDRNEIARLETMLRLQHLLAGDRDEATKPIDDVPPAEQEYWKHQMFELADMLSDKHAGDARRYGLALHALDEATAKLAELSSLSLRSAAFCKGVRDFGSIERFERLDFTRNQEVLLYVEVRNFASQKVSDATFETELQGSYRVLDRSGASKAERVLPLDKQTCANRRRDYYIAYRLFIPSELEPGAYTLELTIEDKKAGKSTNTRVDFNVVSTPPQ